MGGFGDGVKSATYKLLQQKGGDGMAENIQKEQQKEIANRIKERRRALNYTQEQFAEIIGITAGSYTRIENAFQNPAVDTLIKISQNLKISLDYIIFGKDDVYSGDTAETEVLEALRDFSDKDKIKHAVEVLNKLIKIKGDE